MQKLDKIKPVQVGEQQVEIEIPSQNLEIDPRGKSSFRGKGVYIATGDVAEVKGTKAMLPEKKKTAKWY